MYYSLWCMTSQTSDQWLPSQLNRIATAVWPVFISHPAESRRLNCPEWLVMYWNSISAIIQLSTLVHRGSSPSYLSRLVMTTANIPFRERLRSVDTNRYKPLTVTTRLKFGQRCISHAGPNAWNELPTELQGLTDPQCVQTPAEDISVWTCAFYTMMVLPLVAWV